MKGITLLSILAILFLGTFQASAAFVLRLGEFDDNNGEFEMESGAENNNQYYAHAGDYTGLTARTGQGAFVSEPEPLISVGTMDGMQRAVTRLLPYFDIFFQLEPAHLTEDYLLFSTSFIAPGANSNHHLKISLNGEEIWSQLNVNAVTGRIDIALSASEFTFAEGANYLTIERTGGSSSGAWISLDAVHLQAVPEPSHALLACLGLLALCGRRQRSAR